MSLAFQNFDLATNRKKTTILSCGLTKSQDEQFVFALITPPNTRQVYWLNYNSLLFPLEFSPILLNKTAYYNQQNETFISQIALFEFLWAAIGVSAFLLLFGLLMYINNKQMIYLYWSCYLGSNTLFFVLNSDYIFNVPSLPIVGFIIPVQHLIVLFYTLFIQSFFDFKKNSLKLYYASIGLMLFILLLLILSFILIKIDIAKWLIIDDKPFFIVQIWFLSILLSSFTLKVPQKIFIIIGATVMILMSIWAVYIDISGLVDATDFWRSPVGIYGTGFLIELVFLSLALIKRAKFEEEENIRTSNRIKEERTHLQHQVAQTEINALRAQMNPHFIFNCLNSIQLFTAQNQADKASDYLGKFSRLIRLVLENSRSDKVTLDNELETLRLYLDMEAMRFRGKLRYYFDTAPDIAQDTINIPPLLLQPFVENAIWHGLMHKEEGGSLQIQVTQPNENLLRVEIVDDGIGREKAQEFKSKSATKNKSFGMQVTADRIQLINQLYNTQTQVRIIDLEDANGQAAGTQVIVEIPI